MLHFTSQFEGLMAEQKKLSVLTTSTCWIMLYAVQAVLCILGCWFQAYDPELFSKALPCLSAIGCALSPDYTLTGHDDSWFNRAMAESEGVYNPTPVDTSRLVYNICTMSHVYESTCTLRTIWTNVIFVSKYYARRNKE